MTTSRLPPSDRLLNAALAYCGRCDQITEITRQLRAVPGCERYEQPHDGYDGELECLDILETPGSVDEAPSMVMWWEATPEDVAEFCVPCQTRVQLWKERHRLRQTLGGLKATLMRAYRAQRRKA